MTPAGAPGAPGLTGAGDDRVTGFQLEGRPVRGRLVRLGAAADAILSAHDYPVSVARLVGEAALLAVLIGDSLKFDGKLIIQASGPDSGGRQIEGTGAVAFVVADFVPGQGVRAYAKYDGDAVAALEAASRTGARDLLGDGHFAMTLDPGPGKERYQGVTAITGDTLADSAAHYFAQSEQTPTRLRLAVGRQMLDGGHMVWRAGGALIQRIAGDEARGETQDSFEHAQVLFDTLGDDELLDPALTAGQVLFRLFHEDGVRVEEGRPAPRRCSCERASLARLLARFPSDDREHMSGADGSVAMTCEYCNREWRFTAGEIDAAARAND
ncbi:molecular chaperone Hsp33 [Alkalicaulis satelles]|uniref:Molecular chaperone Hsp33 n=1 Tax=Alkalicaulis satelles TaxID=2609175 RepID=A0A5M6ZJC1_9PROT|nr:Hsp33 family molecular chaperone HslO [Alkalicaulis satelles]KAA5804912.1 molecular chaperone Hsp33 [Alkalicaulis satelles]